MWRRNVLRALAAIGLVLAASCGGDCLTLPCPLIVAIRLTVTTSNGATLDSLAIKVTGPDGAQTFTCEPSAGTCLVPGLGGSYRLDIMAPGYQPIQKTVQVSGDRSYGCNTCPRVTTQNVAVTLVAASAFGMT